MATIDWHALLWGAAGSILATGVIWIAHWYSTRYITRSRRRAFETARFQLALFERLDSSDRAVLIYGFQMAFLVLSLLSLGMLAGSLLLMQIFRQTLVEWWGLLSLIALVMLVAMAGSLNCFLLFGDLNNPADALKKRQQKVSTFGGPKP